MKKLMLLCFCAVALFLAGCSEERKFVKSPFGGPDVLACQADGYAAFRSLPYQGSRQQQLDVVPFPGFMVNESEGNVVVDTIIGGENIRKEIRRDDIVTAVNGKPVKSKKQFLELVRGQRFDENIFISFKRYSGEFYLAIRQNQMSMPRMYSNLEKKLLDNKKVSIAISASANVTITDVNINAMAVASQDKEFIGSAFEKTFINEFTSYPNFSIIDRSAVDKIIAEQKFQISGAVDDQTIQKLGKITGATHLLITTISRNLDGFSLTEKLVEVETSKVVYADNYVYIKPKPVVVKKKDKDEDKKEEKKEESKQPVIIINNNINNSNTNTNTTVVSNTNINNNTNTINNK